MTNNLINQTATQVALKEELKELAQQAVTTAESAKAVQTKKMYEVAIRQYHEFLQKYNLTPSKPSAVLFLQHLSEKYAFNSIQQKAAGCKSVYFDDFACKEVRELLIGIKNSKRDEKGNYAKPSKALLGGALGIGKVLASINDFDITGKRNHCLIALGFALASRKSEVIAIMIDDIEFSPKGATIRVWQQKTRSEIFKFVPSTSVAFKSLVRLIDALKENGITSGYLFRRIRKNGLIGSEKVSPEFMPYILRKALEAAGLENEGITTHGLRRGYISTAVQQDKVNPSDLMRHTGHKSLSTIQRYIESTGKESEKIQEKMRGFI